MVRQKLQGHQTDRTACIGRWQDQQVEAKTNQEDRRAPDPRSPIRQRKPDRNRHPDDILDR